ncbi:unannotated protein [freshwater metagenome]|uniref:Unannotated protein n=1 Tax=freshwater metagenome TaxID=449393 RepID=A0A6J6QQM7_9ZZZZ
MVASENFDSGGVRAFDLPTHLPAPSLSAEI